MGLSFAFFCIGKEELKMDYYGGDFYSTDSSISDGDGYTENDIPDDERGNHPMNEGLRQKIIAFGRKSDSSKFDSVIIESVMLPDTKHHNMNGKMNKHFPSMTGISTKSPKEIHGDFLRVLEYVKNKQMESPAYVTETQAILGNDGFTESNLPGGDCGNHYKIGLVSKAFAEANLMDFEYYNENVQASAIRETTYEDVTSEYFIKWFFADEDWLGASVSPEVFNFNMITHSDEKYVYGYFNGDNIDGIIRVDEHDDNYMLSFFITNDSLQNQGIGQSLLQSILQKFTDKKITLRVYTDKDKAIYIYKKYGFEIVDTGYGSGPHPSSPHYVMQRDIQ